MVRQNSIQEAIELEKIKPKLKKSIAAQRKREQNGTWEKVPGSIGNMRKFVPNKKKL